ncbi:MAG: glycosyltransferase family 2 protein [Candidatus Binatia bacterium]
MAERAPSTAPAVSIVLPTYQRGALVARAIGSVLAQTVTDFELLVVDDGSTDDTAAQVARVADRRVRYLRLDVNRGAGAARNVGIRQTRAPLLAFQDSDDEWLPTKLARHLEVLATCGPEVAVVYSDMRRIYRDGGERDLRSPDVVPGVLLDPATGFYQVCGIGIQSTVIRRECLEAVGGFDETLPALEDLELFIRLSRRYAFHHLAEALVRYHETEGLSSNVPAKIMARRAMLRRYHGELTRDDAEFATREQAALAAAAARRQATVTGPA